ncbi:MAG: zinc ribbon domain-containing protein, partial [Candidatus Binatia bacterium]
LQATTAERNGLAGAIDPADLDRYDRLRARRGGVAVVAIRQGHCAGCGVQVPPRLLLDIHRNSGVVTCPSCYRLLYTSIARTPTPATA